MENVIERIRKETKERIAISERQFQRAFLEKDLRSIMNDPTLSLKDTIVMYLNGKETDKTYQVWSQYEQGSDKPKDWINRLMFHWDLGGQKGLMSLRLKRAK